MYPKWRATEVFFNALLFYVTMPKPKKYGLKINYELFEVFKEYLHNHPELGYRSTAEFLNEILRNKAKKILENEDESK